MNHRGTAGLYSEPSRADEEEEQRGHLYEQICRGSFFSQVNSWESKTFQNLLAYP